MLDTNLPKDQNREILSSEFLSSFTSKTFFFGGGAASSTLRILQIRSNFGGEF